MDRPDWGGLLISKSSEGEMAGAAAVLEDSSLLSRLDRALLPVERFCALISGLAIFSLMFLAAY